MSKIVELKRSNAAVEIGRHYRAGTDELIIAGEKLTAQKRAIPHGAWLVWLKDNEEELGFGELTAQRLMKLAANPSLTTDLWGNWGDKVRGTQGTGENEWHTPPEFLERARAVLGVFDLDPASTFAAQRNVKAAKFFTKKEDGLKQQWQGRVWLNPPYAQPLIDEFVNKLLSELMVGATSAIMLTHNYTDTKWFQASAAIADAICFTRGRVRFISPDGEIAAPTQGQAFHYFGTDRESFFREFKDIGFVTVRP